MPLGRAEFGGLTFALGAGLGALLVGFLGPTMAELLVPGPIRQMARSITVLRQQALGDQQPPIQTTPRYLFSQEWVKGEEVFTYGYMVPPNDVDAIASFLLLVDPSTGQPFILVEFSKMAGNVDIIFPDGRAFEMRGTGPEAGMIIETIPI